jgi:hypothetical protein
VCTLVIVLQEVVVVVTVVKVLIPLTTVLVSLVTKNDVNVSIVVKTVVSEVKLPAVKVVVVLVVVFTVTTGSKGISQSTGKRNLPSQIPVELDTVPSFNNALQPNGIGKPSYHPNQMAVLRFGVQVCHREIISLTTSFVIFARLIPKVAQAAGAAENGSPPGI